MRLIILDSKGNSSPINIMESENVLQLKEEIKKKNNITGEIELLYNGKILEDDEYLTDEGIQDNSTINYLGIFKAGKSYKNSLFIN